MMETEVNNNRIKRLRNTIREKTKTMRGARNAKSDEVLRIYYNFVREHSSIQNLTPAEAAGIRGNLDGN